MSEPDKFATCRIRSFVRRQRRITSGQREALDRLWNKYGLESDCHFDARKVFSRFAPTILDIGFGNGEALIEMASKHPGTNYLGIEVYLPGISRLLMRLEQQGLQNVRIYRDDAVDILEHCIEDHCLSGINLFFPDPWPKRRHQKRRLVTPTFARLMARKLQKGSVFSTATDWQGYADQIQSVLSRSIHFVDVSNNPNFIYLLKERPETKFERRGLLRNYTVWNLLFERVRTAC